MSATLSETIESLHIAAARKLTELIQTEKDPSLLARLIATAFRFKLPKPSRAQGERETQPRGRSAAPTRTTPSDRPYATAKNDGLPADDAPASETPLPFTDQQFLELVRRFGPAEADSMRQRRSALIAHLNRGSPITASTS